jgi:Ca2+-transporting ATPase
MNKQHEVWWSLPPDEVAQTLDSNTSAGLTEQEAGARLERDGPNELGEKPPKPAILRLLGQFTDVTVLALIVASLIASLTALLGSSTGSVLEKFRDAIAIGLIVVINAAIGFLQEQKAERALYALRRMGAPVAQVLRAGTLETLAAKSLVTGDLVQLKEGDRIPADLRLVEAFDLATDESALTGESVLVDKRLNLLARETPLAERSNMAFLGTHVVRGRALGLVVATARATELGKIAAMLEGVERPLTPLQERLKRFGIVVVIGCVLVGMVVFAVGLLQQHAAPSLLLLTAVSLAVAVIPEGLPAITTIVLALGVERMAKKHALIRRLPAVESLGAATIICSDKTGTLTQNRMRVRELWCAGRRVSVDDPDAMRRAGVETGFLASYRRLLGAAAYAPAVEDPTDLALLRLFEEAQAEFELDLPARPVLVLPFDNKRRMASVVVARGDGFECFTHGAPEAVLLGATSWFSEGGVQPLDEDTRRRILGSVEELASNGLRVLALAAATVPGPALHALPDKRYERQMTLLGLMGLADPPRPEVQAALAVAKRAGVRTLMITGDHPTTARAIAHELGILEDGVVVTGSEIESLSAEELRASMRNARVVARATAEHKLAIVEALRAEGHVVAMTGDGVNDAPAIKAADIGVAMGQHATDVTREAASMVIYDGSYSTIVDAISEGRTTYQNIKRFILFLFTVNLSLVIAVFVASISGLPPVLTPTQILWINLITNGLPALALGMEPGHEDPMQRPPRNPHEPILRPVELLPMIAYGGLMGALGLAVFLTLEPRSLHLARTAIFTVLAIGPLFHAFNSRSRWGSVFQLGFWSNWRLLGAFLLALCLQGLAVYLPGAALVFDTEPLPLAIAASLFGVSASVWLVGELHKWVERAVSTKRHTLASSMAS